MSISIKTEKKENITKHPLYVSWYKMMYRCYGDKYEKKHRYALRGITVCESWHSINNFITDMYPTYLKGLTLDRIDNNLGYFLENCRWLSREENSTKDMVQGVSQYTLDGVYITNHISIAVVNIVLGLKFNHGGLSRAILQKKPFKGYRWKRSNTTDNLTLDDISGTIINTNIPILQLDINSGSVIKEWSNAKEIINTLGINSGSLSRVCSGKLNQTGGFKWKHKSNPNSSNICVI